MFNIKSTLTAIALTLAAAMQINAADNVTVLSVRDTIKDPNLYYPAHHDAAYHQLQKNWYLNNYILMDKECENEPDVVTTDEQYIQRLAAIPSAIEMPFNSVVRDYIEKFTQRKRGFIETMLGMSTYYMPIFEQALDAEGVPLELRYLPIVESALNPVIVSRAGATGLWQFMLPTARDMELEINSLVDERCDPIAASRAAAHYLKTLYDMYNDWSLAISAYNCGPGNINKALRLAGEGAKDFWDIYYYLPAETRGYFPQFIAINYVMNNYGKHNIRPVLARHPIVTDTVHVNRRIHFNQIAGVLDISVDALQALNPQYRKQVIPGDIKPYVLILPTHQALAYKISEDSIANFESYLYSPRTTVELGMSQSRVSDDGKYTITEQVVRHTVRKGDTFARLARQYGVTEASIKRANNITKLRRGTTISIVTTTKVPHAVEDTEVVAATIETDGEQAAERPEFIVEADTTVVEEPAAAPEPVKPKPQPKPLHTDQPVYHKVRSGDNLFSLSKKYGTTVDKIRKLNPKIKGDRINIGDNLRVK